MIPKFRFFGKVNDGTTHMVLAESIDFKNGFIYYSYHSYTEEEGDHIYGDVIGFEDCVLMQSTGLVDKNGKEIFEGDVVKLKYTVLSDYEFLKVTRFRGGSWRIDNRQRGSELWLRNEDCEIIGNIYENLELVEVNNDQ